MDIKDLEKFFERVAAEYGIPIKTRRKGKTLEVSITVDKFSREFLSDDGAVYDVVGVGDNVEMVFNRRGEIKVSVYNPGSGWDDKERLCIPDINIIGSEFEKNKDKGKYTILFGQDVRSGLSDQL